MQQQLHDLCECVCMNVYFPLGRSFPSVCLFDVPAFCCLLAVFAFVFAFALRCCCCLAHRSFSSFCSRTLPRQVTLTLYAKYSSPRYLYNFVVAHTILASSSCTCLSAVAQTLCITVCVCVSESVECLAPVFVCPCVCSGNKETYEKRNAYVCVHTHMQHTHTKFQAALACLCLCAPQRNRKIIRKTIKAK